LAKSSDSSRRLDALKQKIFGKSSEKMPPMEREVRRGEQPDPAKGVLKRRANAELRAAKIKTEVVDVPVPVTERHCPRCEMATSLPSSARASRAR
jgi:NMD protein affecting ribosome stability and mRNA decay